MATKTRGANLGATWFFSYPPAATSPANTEFAWDFAINEMHKRIFRTSGSLSHLVHASFSFDEVNFLFS